MRKDVFTPIYHDGAMFNVFHNVEVFLMLYFEYATGKVKGDYEFFAESTDEDGICQFESVQDISNFRRHYLLGHRFAVLAVRIGPE